MIGEMLQRTFSEIARSHGATISYGDFPRSGTWRGDQILINPALATPYTVLHEIGHHLCGYMCCREHAEYAAHGAAVALAEAHGVGLTPEEIRSIDAYAGRTADAACPAVEANGERPGPVTGGS